MAAAPGNADPWPGRAFKETKARRPRSKVTPGVGSPARTRPPIAGPTGAAPRVAAGKAALGLAAGNRAGRGPEGPRALRSRGGPGPQRAPDHRSAVPGVSRAATSPRQAPGLSSGQRPRAPGPPPRRRVPSAARPGPAPSAGAIPSAARDPRRPASLARASQLTWSRLKPRPHSREAGAGGRGAGPRLHHVVAPRRRRAGGDRGRGKGAVTGRGCSVRSQTREGGLPLPPFREGGSGLSSEEKCPAAWVTVSLLT